MHGFLGSEALGYKMAFCERDTAIYLAVLLAGLAYGRLRDRLPSLGIVAYGLLILPMALDAFTQVFGWRESTPELREGVQRHRQDRSEEHTSELQSQSNLVCRLL